MFEFLYNPVKLSSGHQMLTHTFYIFTLSFRLYFMFTYFMYLHLTLIVFHGHRISVSERIFSFFPLLFTSSMKQPYC